MKNKLFISLVVLATAVFLSSCEDFIEVDLAKKSMTILAPANNTVSSEFTQQFKWEEVKGSVEYQLQIVKPNFSSIQKFILDTNTTSDNFSYTLDPGTYQWRVRAKNATSNTEYVIYDLTIDSTLDLSGQAVVLVSPTDNYNSGILTNTFTWQTMPNANSYVFQILSGSSVIATQSSTTLTSDYTFSSEGTYQWRVFAQNDYSNSAYTTRTIVIDTTAPVMPTPVSPVTDTITADPVPLKWNISIGTDSTHILISTDSTFVLVSDKDTTIAVSSNPETYNFYSAIVGVNYYWKAQAIDKAGNKSAYFTRRRFKRN